MRAKLGVFFMICLVGAVVGFAQIIEQQRDYFEGIPILNEDRLLQIGMNEIRAYGLIGEPTESTSIILKADESQITMLSTIGFEYPATPIYILSVKGAFNYVPMSGFGGRYIPEGFTVGMYATNGTIFYRSNGYVEDLEEFRANDQDRVHAEFFQEHYPTEVQPPESTQEVQP